MIRQWASIDRYICSGLERLHKGLLPYGKLPEVKPPSPRFTDRLKEFRKLVRKHCENPRGLALLEDATGRLQDWTNLRDDLTHGEISLYDKGPDEEPEFFRELVIIVVPSHGRQLVYEEAYSVPLSTLEHDVTRVVAGFGGMVTGIVGYTLHPELP
jgi:hypothetical protein